MLFTQAIKQYPNTEPFQKDEVVERIIHKISRKYDRAKHHGLLQYWTGYLTVKAFSDRVTRANWRREAPTHSNCCIASA